MKRYSDIVDRIFREEDLLKKLIPQGLLTPAAMSGLRVATEEEISGGRTVSDHAMFALVRAGLFYALDALAECHAIVQAIPGDESAYWHGMIHRREGDFDNARYWFRRTGVLPVFDELHGEAGRVSPHMAAQMNWDPYLFTGLCEQEKYGEKSLRDELVKLQRIEFEVVFDYVWRRSLRG